MYIAAKVLNAVATNLVKTAPIFINVRLSTLNMRPMPKVKKPAGGGAHRNMLSDSAVRQIHSPLMLDRIVALATLV